MRGMAAPAESSMMMFEASDRSSMNHGGNRKGCAAPKTGSMMSMFESKPSSKP
jgi:hypothetical protein